MVLIFGWSPRRRRIETLEEPLHCPHCGHPSRFERYDVRSWFRLFLVPIFPVGERYHVIECGDCGYAVEIPASRIHTRQLQGNE